MRLSKLIPMELTLNTANGTRKIGHDGICKQVKDHTPAELKSLALIGLRSGNKLITDCFINLPTLSALEADNTSVQIATIKASATPNT